MTVHGIVIAFLLLFPLVLVGVVIVGATSSAVKRRLEHLQRAWRERRRTRFVPSLPPHALQPSSSCSLNSN